MVKIFEHLDKKHIFVLQIERGVFNVMVTSIESGVIGTSIYIMGIIADALKLLVNCIVFRKMIVVIAGELLAKKIEAVM